MLCIQIHCMVAGRCFGGREEVFLGKGGQNRGGSDLRRGGIGGDGGAHCIQTTFLV